MPEPLRQGDASGDGPRTGHEDRAGHEAEADPDDATLVTRTRRDRRAFAPLYRRYVGPVYAYCHRRLGTKEAAEDATSLVFAKALSGLPGYRGDRTFRSWLFAIAHNVVVDGHRARRPDRPLDDALDVPGAEPAPEEAALIAAEHDAVRTLLARLPPDQRRVLELRLAGLSGAEVARVLGRSPGAVKVAQFRAYARLRASLGAERAGRGETDDADGPREQRMEAMRGVR